VTVTIGIVIPTCGRADRLGAVVENIRSATGTAHEIVLVVEPDDTDSAAAGADTGAAVVVNGRARSYAGAANSAYQQVGPAFDFLFAGSDDLRFHLDWDVQALRKMDTQVHVVGTNDLLNPYVARGWHATHYLIDRRYLDDEGGVVDEGPGSFLLEGYDHQVTDTEFIGTAKARARFRPCLDSVVEHMHFLAGKSPRDDRYDRAYAHEEDDSMLYDERRSLWWDLSR
jgi:hypothetical protein